MNYIATTIAISFLVTTGTAYSGSSDTQISVEYKIYIPKGDSIQTKLRNFNVTLLSNGTVNESHSERSSGRAEDLGGSRWKVVDANTLRRVVQKDSSVRTFTIKVSGQTCSVDFTSSGVNRKGIRFEVVSCSIK